MRAALFYARPGMAVQADAVSFKQSGNGTALRTILDKGSEIVSVEDFVSTGGDDAVAWRSAIAELARRGGGILVSTKPTYTFKSYVAPPAAVTWQNDPCVLFDGLSNITFVCGHSTILIDNAISGPHANGSGHSHFGIHNCKNFAGDLPKMMGNRTGLAADKFNNGLWFESCIEMNFPPLSFGGDYNGGSCVAGGHIYDSEFAGMKFSNASFGFDVTCIENVKLGNVICTDPAAVFPAAVKLFYDAVSAAYNVTGRALISGMSSNVSASILTKGASAAAYIEAVDGCDITVNASQGTRGVIIGTGAAINAAGKITKNVSVKGNVTGMTDSAVVLDTGGFGLDGISIKGLTVANCAGYSVSAVTAVNLGLVNVKDNDWTKQTQKIDPSLVQIIASSKGFVTGNSGYNPQGIGINRALPGAVGVANKSVNTWAFPVEVTVNTTGVEYVTHIIEPDGTDINLGVASPKVPQTITLQPNAAIYFEASLPTQWQWRGQ